jgi:hypothetical protein
MSESVFGKLTAFLSDLEESGISYDLAHHRDEAIMVKVAVPGQRWEIEFFDDGSVEIERFISSGEIYGAEMLSELFARYADPEPDSSALPQELVTADSV